MLLNGHELALRCRCDSREKDSSIRHVSEPQQCRDGESKKRGGKEHTLIVGKLITLFDWQTLESPLKWQTRVVSCVKRADQPGLPPVQPGFAVGSVEGRVAFQYIKESDKA
jgi:hypothetical protein